MAWNMVILIWEVVVLSEKKGMSENISTTQTYNILSKNNTNANIT